MNTIMIRDSEEPGDWRDGFVCGHIAAYRPQTRTQRGIRAGKVKTILLAGVFLSAMDLAFAANTTGVSGVANTVNLINAPSAGNAAGLGNSLNTAAAAEATRHWAVDTGNGCKVWSPEPIGTDVTVRWGGRCESGLAQGRGTLRWLSNNKQVEELTGTMEQGKVRGHTFAVEEPGNRFEGMFIDSLPEGEGKVSFVDGSTYTGQWHRGRRLGYGIMTFPPAHPQYQEMVNNGKGSKVENGVYVLRGWWEGKTFVTACDSEEACEKVVAASMKGKQSSAAAKTGAPDAAAPISAPGTPAAEPDSGPATPAIPDPGGSGG